MLRACVSVCGFAVLAVLSSTSVTAQTFDQRTYFTFSQPVALPGVTLPAGKYLFRVVDTTSSRRVVQVLDAEGRKSYAMLLSIPAQRHDAPPSPEVRFMETPSNAPSALKTWWYPGNTIGHEFIYPKSQALQLARDAGTSVLTTVNAANATTEEMKSADLARVSQSGSETAVSVEARPAVTDVAGTAQPGDIASASLQIADVPAPVTPAPAATASAASASTSPAPSAPAASPAPARTELPQTASTLPLVTMLGALSLLTGVILVAGPHVRL